MKSQKIIATITLEMAWWFEPYIICLACFCAITGLEPNEKRLMRVIDRAMRPVVNLEE